MTGRIALIKSTLSTIPLYSMQPAKISQSICEDLDRRIRKFLWKWALDEHGIKLVSWDMITKPPSCGGLGIRSMRQANAAFMAKLGWRLLNEPQSL
ncbi:hypothetical protein vseg_016121 [Gypsophila vaccaria]